MDPFTGVVALVIRRSSRLKDRTRRGEILLAERPVFEAVAYTGRVVGVGLGGKAMSKLPTSLH